MTSSLTVIGLVTRLKISTHTSCGDAIYREKITNQTYTFGIKQFTNARDDYNESFKEGDLVLFGGKFTIEESKLMVNIILLISIYVMNSIIIINNSILFIIF